MLCELSLEICICPYMYVQQNSVLERSWNGDYLSGVRTFFKKKKYLACFEKLENAVTRTV